LHSTVETNPGRDLFYKPRPTPALRAAAHSFLGRVYLDWSSWPLVNDIGPVAPPDSPPGTPDWTAVSFRDLRFMYDTAGMQGRNDPPLSGTVDIGGDGQVESMKLGSRVQR